MPRIHARRTLTALAVLTGALTTTLVQPAAAAEPWQVRACSGANIDVWYQVQSGGPGTLVPKGSCRIIYKTKPSGSNRSRIEIWVANGNLIDTVAVYINRGVDIRVWGSGNAEDASYSISYGEA
ncbi:hypothetical protein AB0E59_42475 [Lentzea sp. NPDC034063]|uniref:hypothetical protein n=1 Tax=unclassified Lentzea TaxID=2643253 RepID=UPI0033F06C6F